MEPTARDDRTDPVPTDEMPPVWRKAAFGAVAGFVLSTVAVVVAGVAGGMGAGAALGLGAFVGLWGGVGFGFMMGATVPLSRHLDAAHARRPAGPGQVASH